MPSCRQLLQYGIDHNRVTFSVERKQSQNSSSAGSAYGKSQQGDAHVYDSHVACTPFDVLS